MHSLIFNTELKMGETTLNKLSAEDMLSMVTPAPRTDNGHKSAKAEEDCDMGQVSAEEVSDEDDAMEEDYNFRGPSFLRGAVKATAVTHASGSKAAASSAQIPPGLKPGTGSTASAGRTKRTASDLHDTPPSSKTCARPSQSSRMGVCVE